MKKLITVTFIVLFIFVSNTAYAKGNKVKMPSFKYKGSHYTLYYGAKSKETGGFINEYYKPRESYTNWSELMAIHHYPHSSDPVEHAKAFAKFVENRGLKMYVEPDTESNTAIVDFVMVQNKRLPIVLEYNIFKYSKSPVCGTQAVQYAKRYLLSNALIVDKVLRDIDKTRLKQIKAFKKLETPELIAREIDRGVYVVKPDEKTDEKTQTKSKKGAKTKKNKKEFINQDPFQEFFLQSDEFIDKELLEEPAEQNGTFIDRNPCNDFFEQNNNFENFKEDKQKDDDTENSANERTPEEEDNTDLQETTQPVTENNETPENNTEEVILPE